MTSLNSQIILEGDTCRCVTSFNGKPARLVVVFRGGIFPLFSGICGYDPMNSEAIEWRDDCLSFIISEYRRRHPEATYSDEQHVLMALRYEIEYHGGGDE